MVLSQEQGVVVKEGILVSLLYVKKQFRGTAIVDNATGNVLVESVNPVKEN